MIIFFGEKRVKWQWNWGGGGRVGMGVEGGGRKEGWEPPRSFRGKTTQLKTTNKSKWHKWLLAHASQKKRNHWSKNPHGEEAWSYLSRREDGTFRLHVHLGLSHTIVKEGHDTKGFKSFARKRWQEQHQPTPTIKVRMVFELEEKVQKCPRKINDTPQITRVKLSCFSFLKTNQPSHFS